MRKLLLIIGLAICYNSLIAQTVPLRFSSRITINNISVYTDPYTVSGTVNDITSNWDANDIQVGDSLYLVDGSNLLVYSVVSITSASGPNFTIVIDDINDTGILPPLSSGLMIRPTPNKKFTWFTGGVSEYIQTLVANRNAQRLDESFSNLQTDSPVRDTITQTAHGFSRLTPIRQIAGSFVLADADIAPAEGVVVDSIDANTFVLGRNGLFVVPSHGLQIDTTYYLSTTAGQLVTYGNRPPNVQQQVLTPKSTDKILIHEYPLFQTSSSADSTINISDNDGDTYIKSDEPSGAASDTLEFSIQNHKVKMYDLNGTLKTDWPGILDPSAIQLTRQDTSDVNYKRYGSLVLGLDNKYYVYDTVGVDRWKVFGESSQQPQTTRVTVIASGKTGSQTISSSGAVNIANINELTDSTNSYNPAAGAFVAPRNGYYLIDVMGVVTGTWSTNGFVSSWLNITNNASSSTNNFSQMFPTIFNTGSHSYPIRFGGTAIVKLIAGAVVNFQVSVVNSSSVTLPSWSDFRFNVKELPPNW